MMRTVCQSLLGVVAQTIDIPMLSTEENVRKDNDNVVKGSGEAEGSNGKDAEVPIKVIRMPRPPPPFPQRLVKRPRMVNTDAS